MSSLLGHHFFKIIKKTKTKQTTKIRSTANHVPNNENQPNKVSKYPKIAYLFDFDNYYLSASIIDLRTILIDPKGKPPNNN